MRFEDVDKKTRCLIGLSVAGPILLGMVMSVVYPAIWGWLLAGLSLFVLSLIMGALQEDESGDNPNQAPQTNTGTYQPPASPTRSQPQAPVYNNGPVTNYGANRATNPTRGTAPTPPPPTVSSPPSPSASAPNTAAATTAAPKGPVETYLFNFDKNIGGFVVERDGEYIGVVTGQKLNPTVSTNDYAKKHGCNPSSVVYKEVPYPTSAGGDPKKSKAFEATSK